jgi:Zn-finger nucleic acid-binding protein
MWWNKRPEWLDELGAKLESLAEESKKRDEEFKKRDEESKRRDEESKRRDEEYKRREEELRARINALTLNVCGISDSNGLFAEEFFFNTLSKKKEFAGIHFDEVEDDFKGTRKQPDGKRVKDQFDIVMTNAASVAVVEVKYKARKDDVETLAGRKLENFKILFPEYNGFKIYLGLAALVFEDEAVKEARKYGVGLLQQVGETMEYATDWEVKAY